ncbi:MAG: HmuY family protein [Desulfobulbaceae bacterium]|nr:HmuY family protein [Candidatus Kapabacteria bacterium]MBS3999933.1 HmuY family protein [Desulfobulbaceae bacterium]
MKKIIIYIAFLAIGLTSCFEDEIPVSPYPRGDEQIATVDLTSKYIYQVYFNFEKGQAMKSNLYDVWDLAFQCYGDDFYVLLNGAKFMEAADMGTVDFASLTSQENAAFKYDSTNLVFEDFAIGKWWSESSEGMAISKNHVYIVNRGRDTDNRRQGIYKVQFLGFEDGHYNVRFAELKSTTYKEIKVPRKENFNFIMLSLSGDGEVLELEPAKDDWDIVYTKYIAFLPFEGGLLPYSVTGILINHTQTEAARDSGNVFKDISFEMIDDYKFSNQPDIIGHEWKWFDLESETYLARPDKNFLIRDGKGFYWKFHIIEYYNQMGERGYPQMEFKKL